MAPSIPDLWPEDLVAGGQQTTPLAVLRRQGLALGEKTHNLVYGEVQSRAFSDGKRFEHTFVLVAPLLGYRTPLLRVTHDVSLYPAQLAETDLTKEPSGSYWNANADDMDKFKAVLQEFFARKPTLNVVRSLVSQSSDYGSDDSGRNGSSA